jgi:asparaginyl-tRNA synthetase
LFRRYSGCSIIATGTLVESQGQGQSVEVQAIELEVVGWVDDPEKYPIAKKRHTFEYLRTQAHLRPRTNAIGAVTRVRSTLANAIHNYFYQGGFQWVNTPIITNSDCEGAGELFRVSTLDMENLPRTDILLGQPFVPKTHIPVAIWPNFGWLSPRLPLLI